MEASGWAKFLASLLLVASAAANISAVDTAGINALLHGVPPEAVDMNGRFQMQGGKNWFLPKEMNANRFFWDSHWLEIWSNHFYPSMGPNGGSVAMDSGVDILMAYCYFFDLFSSVLTPLLCWRPLKC